MPQRIAFATGGKRFGKIFCENVTKIYFQVEYTEDQNRARRIAAHLEMDELDGGSSEDDYFDDNAQEDEVRVYLPAEKHCDRIVLQSVLAPFTNTYAAVAYSLNHLLDGNTMVEGEFIRQCIKEITTRVEQGQCKYGKCLRRL